jgi:Zn-dependent peptidase ImmA (M78 family)
MAGKAAPINPDVLEWAFLHSGLTENEFSFRSKILPDRLRSIRRGEELPLTGEFKNIAKALGRPTAFFFLPAPPRESYIPVSFRAPAGRNEERSLTSEEQKALRDAARWQRISSWVRQKHENADVRLPLVNLKGTPEAAARVLTNWLHWNVLEQRNTSSSSALLRALRLRLEEKGILVLQYSLGQDSCRGFSFPHELAPVVALNSTYNQPARVFTLLHELAHLVRGDRAVCGDPRYSEIERWCERVAAVFLMPSADVLSYLDRWVTSGEVSDVDHVRRLANRYRISLRAAAVRLAQLKRAVPGLYNTVDKIAEFGGGGPNPNAEPQTTPVLRLRKLGNAVPQLLLDACASGILSDTEVRRYLDVNGSQLNELQARITSSTVEV